MDNNSKNNPDDPPVIEVGEEVGEIDAHAIDAGEDDTPLIETGELDPEESTEVDLIAHGIERKASIDQLVRQFLDDTFPEAESPSQKIEKLDLRPTMEFVEQNLELFEARVLSLASKGGPKSNRKFTNGLNFKGFEKTDDNGSLVVNQNCQVPLIRLKQIIFSLPSNLVWMSGLNTVLWVDRIPVPEVDREDYCTGKVFWHDENDFNEGRVHPSRLFVGSTGKFQYEDGPKPAILLNPVPSTVSTNEKAKFNYLIYVFLREFMHTVLDPMIENNMAGRVVLDNAKDDDNLELHLKRGEAKTLGQWMAELRYSIISGKEPVLTSIHSEIYEEQLRHPDPKEYLPALKELVCETFAAYLLNIMPNKHGYLSFQDADFGNRSLKNGTSAKSGCGTDRLRLIKELCESKFHVT